MRKLALHVMKILIDNGYEASLIGGSIRNALHNSFHNDNLSVKDYDIVTNASYEDVSKLFEDVNARGEQFKVAVVKIDGVEFEVAQYRRESYPEEGSLRPNVVYSVDTLKEDVMRRDFTMNGIAHDKDGKMIDYISGFEDIKNKIIRAIGNPNERFAEDPLRMLRAFRFMSQLGYEIEEDTKLGIKANLDRLRKIPHERVKEEINKLLKGRYAYEALTIMKELEVFNYSFYNSILKKEVKLFDVLFNLHETDYKMSLSYLFENHNMSLVDIYFVLYANADVEKSKEELNNMMFLNNDDIFKVTLLLKHKDIVKFPTENALVELVKDVGEQRGQTYLQHILDVYHSIYNIDFAELKDALARPLFIYQLPINGEDVITLGERMGVTQKGKWIHQVLQFTQFASILGKSVYLEQIMQIIFEGNNIQYKRIKGGENNEKHRDLDISNKTS